MPKPSRWIQQFFVLVLAQTVGASVATSLASGLSRSAVLVGAFKKGESADAIALDQVMLRAGEKDFVLWVPHDEFEIRIFGMKGRVNSAHSDGSPRLTIEQDPLRPNAR